MRELRWSLEAARCAVYENVEALCLASHRLKQGMNSIDIAQVRLDNGRPGSKRFDLGAGRAGLFFVAEIIQNEGGPVGSQSERDSPANPTRPAGNERGLSRQRLIRHAAIVPEPWALKAGLG